MKGHIRQRTEDTWSIIIEAEKGPDGKRRQKWHKFKGTRKEAEQERIRLLHTKQTGEYVEPSKQTVGEFLARWLRGYVQTSRPQSIKFYGEIVNANLIPGLGHVQLTKLGMQDVQAAEKLALELDYQDHGLVCARPDGQPLLGSSVTHTFKALLRRLAIPDGRFHDLRHAHATMLLRAGINPKVVSERLGHATVAITLDLYSHVMPGMQQEAARKVGLVMQAAKARRGVDGNAPAEYPAITGSLESRLQNGLQRAKRSRGMRARKTIPN